MGFFDELKKLAHPYDDEDDDFFGSASDGDEAAREAESAPRRASFFSEPEEVEPVTNAIRPRRKPGRHSEYLSGELRRQADAADAAEASAPSRRARSRASEAPDVHGLAQAL